MSSAWYGVPSIAVFCATACFEMPGVTYRPNFRPCWCTYDATACMPSRDPDGGNFAGSVTHRP